jgi:hypothetical protein
VVFLNIRLTPPKFTLFLHPKRSFLNTFHLFHIGYFTKLNIKIVFEQAENIAPKKDSSITQNIFNWARGSVA